MRKLLLLVILSMCLGIVGCSSGKNDTNIKKVSGMKVLYAETSDNYKVVGVGITGDLYLDDQINIGLQAVKDFDLITKGYEYARVDFIYDEVLENNGVVGTMFITLDNENKVAIYTYRDQFSVLKDSVEVKYSRIMD